MGTIPPGDAPTVVDLRVVARSVREETVYTFALISFARRILRGRKVPRDIRRALAAAERAAQVAREEAQRLDEIAHVAIDDPNRPRG